MGRNKRSEVRKIIRILREITELAEEGAFPGGIQTSIKRYNAILRHLEGESEVLPVGLFLPLSEQEGAVTFDHLGVECRLLIGYLEEDSKDEEENRDTGKIDFGPVIALAPFLERSDLKRLVKMHLSGKNYDEADTEEEEGRSHAPDLKLLVGLAPHMEKKELTELVAASLARRDKFDPKLILALAPHMDSGDLGRLLKEFLPEWFNSKEAVEQNARASFGMDLTPSYSPREPWDESKE